MHVYMYIYNYTIIQLYNYTIMIIHIHTYITFALHYITLHYITLHYTTLHYTTLVHICQGLKSRHGCGTMAAAVTSSGWSCFLHHGNLLRTNTGNKCKQWDTLGTSKQWNSHWKSDTMCGLVESHGHPRCSSPCRGLDQHCGVKDRAGMSRA